ncbi:FxsA family protein [Corynebacterium lubricantis]|uniref:FxsA family protein n=1 Tax=Corynebacterium lubricantis TaxID=541095 RepID=UPI00036CF3C8|nr:FxsA family protein [Corynebacterium lubricantis]
MPLVLGYVLVELVAFIALGAWIGYGWAILTAVGLMLFGSLLASISLRRTLQAANSPQANAGRIAGDTGLIMAGWVLSLVPGIVSSIIGLLLVFGPTRALIRRSAARRLTHGIEDFGVRMYEQSPMAQQHTQYGSFGDDSARRQHPSQGYAHPMDQNDMVIDEEEIKEWSEGLDPDDFKEGK